MMDNNRLTSIDMSMTFGWVLGIVCGLSLFGEDLDLRGLCASTNVLKLNS